MLNNDPFYFSLLRKYQKVFGSLFNDILINRTDANNNVSQVINVPIQYAQKEKMLTRVQADPNISRPEEVTLPTMSFFMSGYEYDNSRMNAQVRPYVITQQNSNITYTYSAAPWNFNFELYLYVKNTEDANKILEQILPFFTPSWTASVFLLPNMQSIDLPVEFVNLNHEDMDDGSFKNNPFLVWTLSFILKGFLWGPVRNGVTINTIDVQYYVGDAPVANVANIHAYGLDCNLYPNTTPTGTELDFIKQYQPGLTANGEPTSNQAQTIPVANINYNTDWGVIETTFSAQDLAANSNLTPGGTG